MLFFSKENGFCIFFFQFWELWATNVKKIFEKNYCPFLPKNTEYEKNFVVIFTPKGSVWNACKLYETMDPVSGLGSEK